MLAITKEQIDNCKSYPIYLIDELTENYIAERLSDIIDFSEQEELFGYTYNKNDKLEDLKNNIHIYGYETGDQHPTDNLYISINLNFIYSKYKNYNIDYYAEPRTFDGYYEEIKEDLEKYLEFFNTEFNKILKEVYEQEAKNRIS